MLAYSSDTEERLDRAHVDAAAPVAEVSEHHDRVAGVPIDRTEHVVSPSRRTNHGALRVSVGREVAPTIRRELHSALIYGSHAVNVLKHVVQRLPPVGTLMSVTAGEKSIAHTYLHTYKHILPADRIRVQNGKVRMGMHHARESSCAYPKFGHCVVGASKSRSAVRQCE